MNVSAGTPRTSFFPRCELCFSLFCPSPLHRAVLNKCNQQGSLGGMSVTKTNGSLQILQARWTSLSLQERRLKDTMVYCPHIPSRSPSLCFFFFFFFLQTSNFLTFLFSKSVHLYWWQCSRRHNTAVVTLWFQLHQDSRCDRERRGGGEVQSSSRSDTSHGCTEFRDSVKLFCDISNPLSPFVLSASHLYVCFSPAVLSFSVFPQCLHFEPDSINLSGKLQMFWAELCKPRRNKAAKSTAFSLYFIIHHGPRSSQAKTWLIK